MYKPAPPRPKKTDNTRSRTGCQSCRQRRTKCDEKKPTCGTCARLNRVCQGVKPQLKFQPVATLSSKPRPHSAEIRDGGSPIPPAIARKPGGFNIPLPSLGLVRSLQHTERDVFYTTYCEDRCMPALHPVFQQVLLLSDQHPMLKDAILALASCNISRSTAEPKFSLSATCLGALRPSLVHQTRSLLYCSQALKSFASLSHCDLQKYSSIALAVMVIFAHIESSIGNFAAFDCHVRGLSAFLSTLQGRTRDTLIRSILTAWMQPRFVVWWSQAHYRSIETQRQLPPVPLPAIAQSNFGSLEERRVRVLSIMCESYRLNVRAVIRYWSLSPVVLEGTHPAYNSNDDLNTTFSLLAAESTKLDEWLFHIPPAEQPCMENIANDGSSMPSEGPVYFQSHDAALNYAYYIVGRIMQCTNFLQLLPSQDLASLGHECSDVEPWLRLLLRVTKSSDMQTSLLRNKYTIGFSNLLSVSFLRCQDLSLSIQIENWLQALENMNPTEEGSFPIFQALGVVKAVNEQRRMDRDVFAVSQPVDNAGGSKFSCYCGQPVSSLLLHGKSRNTGELFTDCISIGRQKVKR